MSLLENTKELIKMYKLGNSEKVVKIIDDELVKIPDTSIFRKKGYDIYKICKKN